MSYLTKSLSTNESIELIIKPHWIYLLPITLFNLLCVFLYIAAYTHDISLKIPLLIEIAGCGYFGYKILPFLFTEQGVTNKRLVHKTGIIGIHTDEMKLTAIETIDLRQSILGRILGYGSVHITGRGVSDLDFINIVNPLETKRLIESVVPQLDERNED